MKVLANYYQQFDADFESNVPAEGYGGWKRTEVEIATPRTAVVLMHAWDCGTREQFPGWHRVADFIPRATKICRTVIPGLLSAVRASPLRLMHVVAPAEHYKDLPGYKLAQQYALPEPARAPQVQNDPLLEKLREFKRAHSFPGLHNIEDINRGFKALRYPKEAEPLGDEPVVESGEQLYGLCKLYGINHLIYCGFAINWCIFYSAGGMLEMERHGCMCSIVRDATTAVENKETARHEWGKETALWRVALQHGFVFDSADLIAAARDAANQEPRNVSAAGAGPRS